MVYWKGLSKFVREYVRNFVVYQKNNYESMTSPETLQPFSVLEGIFTNITMDFIEALPKSNGKTVIMVVVDRFTTYAHLIGLQHPYFAKTVAQVFLDHVYKLYGMPTIIVSDRDPLFTCQF